MSNDAAFFQAMTPGEIVAKLTSRGEQFSEMVWVGENYSKADLLRDLRALAGDGDGGISKLV